MHANAMVSAGVGSGEDLLELTARELEVLDLMAGGLSNAGIAETLFLSERTVEAHTRSIFLKLGMFPAPAEHRRVRAVVSYLAWKPRLESIAA